MLSDRSCIEQALHEPMRLMDEGAGHANRGVTPNLGDRAAYALEALPSCRGRRRPIHTDLHVGNMIFVDAGDRFIDIESMSFGCACASFACLAGKLFEVDSADFLGARTILDLVLSAAGSEVSRECLLREMIIKKLGELEWLLSLSRPEGRLAFEKRRAAQRASAMRGLAVDLGKR